MFGTSNTGFGVVGQTETGVGIHSGLGTLGALGHIESGSEYGVYGYNDKFSGSRHGSGVHGRVMSVVPFPAITKITYGELGRNEGGRNGGGYNEYGVYGYSPQDTDVHGEVQTGLFAVVGWNHNGSAGVYGINDGGDGVIGICRAQGELYGVYGKSDGNAEKVSNDNTIWVVYV